MSPEQRLSGATFGDPCFAKNNQSFGGSSMKAKNNTGAPQLQFNWKNLVLVFLHVVVLVVSVNSHPIRTSNVVPRALPEALHRCMADRFDACSRIAGGPFGQP
jgi:hypothetical protein